MKIIDGKRLNQDLGEAMQKELLQNGYQPRLGIILVGEDPASLSFTKVKKVFGEKFGFSVELFKLSEAVGKNEIISKIKEVEESVDSLIVQLPLPAKFKNETVEILSNISPEKDVDNLSGKNFFTSPIILALEKITNFKPENKIAIVGLGQVVGMPIAKYLQARNLNFVEVDKGEFEKIKDCDVVISAIGKPGVIGAEFIKPGSILIDYGCSFVEGHAHGDFSESCYEKSSEYTPVPGGMGPLVVACLFENVLKSFKNKI